MRFYRKRFGQNPKAIINLARVNYVSVYVDAFTIVFRLFNEEVDEEIYWKYDDAIQFDREYTRLCKALGLGLC